LKNKDKSAEYASKKGDGFVTRVQQTRSDKKDELRKIILAHSDISGAYEAAVQFLNIVKVGSKYRNQPILLFTMIGIS